MTFMFWLINADLRKCVLIPADYHLIDLFLVYLPVCVTMIFCYGKILAIWWKQRKQINVMTISSAPGAPPVVQETAATASHSTQNSNVSNARGDPQDKPQEPAGPPSTGPATMPAMLRGPFRRLALPVSNPKP